MDTAARIPQTEPAFEAAIFARFDVSGNQVRSRNSPSPLVSSRAARPGGTAPESSASSAFSRASVRMFSRRMAARASAMARNRSFWVMGGMAVFLPIFAAAFWAVKPLFRPAGPAVPAGRPTQDGNN